MLAPPRAGRSASPLKTLLENAPSVLLAPVPLALLQPMFTRIASHVAQSRPELFARLGPHAGKRFLIDPTDLPFVLVLTPLPAPAGHYPRRRRMEKTSGPGDHLPDRRYTPGNDCPGAWAPLGIEK